MSIKLSKKQLVRMAERLDAIRCPVDNVYTYENIVYSIERINCHPGWRTECSGFARFESLFNVMEYMERVADETGADCITCKQIAYSAGTYGNTGQLHAVQFWSDDKIINTLFIY